MADYKDEAGKDNEDLDRDVHKLILDRINNARRPEDLDDLELEEAESKEPRIARSLLDQRNVLGPFGFTHIKQLEAIKGVNRRRGLSSSRALSLAASTASLALFRLAAGES